ncbi:MAG: PAS domain-containing protein [Alphaproteobacteria bacterium]|nr:PAS domain-containing protein [Alphaproteobacteria bacterium]
MNERIKSLLDLWEAKRAGRALPARADFAMDDLLPWLGHLMLLDVLEGGDDFRFVLYGTALVEIFGFDLTGKRVSEAIPQIGPSPLEEYRRVCATRAPDYVARRSPADREYVSITKIALPLSSDGRTIDKILGAIYRID